MAPPPKPTDEPRSLTLGQLVALTDNRAGDTETTDLVTIDPDASPPALRPHDAERLAELWERTTPPSTQRARDGARAYFAAWYRASFGGEMPLPVGVEVVVRFVTDHYEGLPHAIERELVEAGIKRPGPHSVSTIQSRLAHLSKLHTNHGHDSPTRTPVVRELLARLRRDRAAQGGVRKARAADLVVLDRLVGACLRNVGPDATRAERLRGLRDAALFLGAWDAGGRRRSEITGLRIEELDDDGEGMAWRLGRSKTDPEGRGLELWIGPRAASAIREWIADAGITEGAVFRPVNRHGHVGPKALTGRSMAQIVKDRAAEAGLDPERFSAHSLRAGFVTEGGKRGYSLQEIMRLSGHRSAEVALGYHQAGAARLNRAAGMAG